MKKETLRLDATSFTLATLNVADEQHGRIIWSNGRTEIDSAMTDALNHLSHRIIRGEAPEMDIRFRFAPHPIHGDSGNVRGALDGLKRSGFVRPTDHTYRCSTFNRSVWMNAEQLHNKLLAEHIGSIDLYRPLASRFVTILSGIEVEPLPALSEA